MVEGGGVSRSALNPRTQQRYLPQQTDEKTKAARGAPAAGWDSTGG